MIKTVLERNRANHKVEMVSESAPAPTLKDCGPRLRVRGSFGPTSSILVRIQTPEIVTSNLSQPESGRLRWWLTFPAFGSRVFLEGAFGVSMCLEKAPCEQGQACNL